MAKEKTQEDYTLADVLEEVRDGSLASIARLARLYPALVAGLLKDPMTTLALALRDKKALASELKVREGVGLKQDPVEKAVDKEADAANLESLADALLPENEPENEPEPTSEPEPAPKPVPAKGKGKGKAKGEQQTLEPAKQEPVKGKKAEDDMDALLNELEDAAPSDGDEGDGGDGDGGEGDGDAD